MMHIFPPAKVQITTSRKDIYLVLVYGITKELRSRQNGNTAEVITYADKANTRLKSRYYKFIRNGKKKNVAVAATARELAFFMWGMMTDNTGIKTA